MARGAWITASGKVVKIGGAEHQDYVKSTGGISPTRVTPRREDDVSDAEYMRRLALVEKAQKKGHIRVGWVANFVYIHLHKKPSRQGLLDLAFDASEALGVATGRQVTEFRFGWEAPVKGSADYTMDQLFDEDLDEGFAPGVRSYWVHMKTGQLHNVPGVHADSYPVQTNYDDDQDDFDYVYSKGWVRAAWDGKKTFYFSHSSRLSTKKVRDLIFDIAQEKAKGAFQVYVDVDDYNNPNGPNADLKYRLMKKRHNTMTVKLGEDLDESWGMGSFFLLPGGKIIKVNSHWGWIEDKRSPNKAMREKAIAVDTMEPMFRAGWWRGEKVTSSGVRIYLETYPFPSKQKIIDALWDVITAFNIAPKSISLVTVETDMKGVSKFKEYRGYELLDEERKMDEGLYTGVRAFWVHRSTGRVRKITSTHGQSPPANVKDKKAFDEGDYGEAYEKGWVRAAWDGRATFYFSHSSKLNDNAVRDLIFDIAQEKARGAFNVYVDRDTGDGEDLQWELGNRANRTRSISLGEGFERTTNRKASSLAFRLDRAPRSSKLPEEALRRRKRLLLGV